MHRRLFVFIILILSAVSAVSAQDRTVINSAKAKQMLLGKHKLSLQWISWDYFGTATITEKRGLFHLTGRQAGRGSTDFVSVDGIISSVDEKEFTFKGTIVTQVSHINGGKPCARDGDLTFRITGKRKYWRLQEINNPCDEAADYVDIYFR